jgi:deoxyribonuclease-4
MTAVMTDVLGAHVSIAGGVQTAPPRGTAIGATALQLFTKTPNQWREPTIDDATADAFKAAAAESGIRHYVVHDSYLINLASPDDALRAKSKDSFSAELRRCAALGITHLVSHPGNYMDDHDDGIRRNAASIAECLDRVPDGPMICLETTAGSGTVLGRTFEELAAIRGELPAAARARIGFCADTCHLYSAGYDLVNDFDGVWRQFDAVLGLEHLRVLHLNDSKHPFGSRKDRHELIGEGTLGPAPFRAIMSDPRFAAIPKLLETPKGDDETTQDLRMLALLRSFAP